MAEKSPNRRTVKEIVVVKSARWSMQKMLKDFGGQATAVVAIAAVIYGMGDHVIPWLVNKWNDDPSPVEGKIQHAADLQREIQMRQDNDRAHDASQTKIVQQLDATAQTLTSVVVKQQQDYKDGLTARLSRQQSALDTAKAFYDKDPSPENKAVIEALQKIGRAHV